MARTRKITTIEDTADAVELETVETPPPRGDEMTVAEKLAELMQQDGTECVSRIYKENTRNPQEKRVYLERKDFFVDEEYLAENWGGGRYVVYYKYIDVDGTRRQTSLTFSISDVYKGSRMSGGTVDAPKSENGLLGAFLGNMTPEKMAGALALVEGVKRLLAPPPPPVDVTELIKALAAPRAPSVGDAVLIKALEGVNRPAPAPAPSILTQLKELQEVKDIISNSETSQSGGDMDTLIKIGLQMLPGLLQKNGGDYQATGAAVRDNPAITGLIANDPELAGRFITAAADKYGIEAAQKLAAGFGYSYEPAPAETSTETAEITAEPKKG